MISDKQNKAFFKPADSSISKNGLKKNYNECSFEPLPLRKACVKKNRICHISLDKAASVH